MRTPRRRLCPIAICQEQRGAHVRARGGKEEGKVRVQRAVDAHAGREGGAPDPEFDQG